MVPPPRDAFHLRLDRMGQAKDFIAEQGVAFRSPFFSPSQKRIEQRGECHSANESEQIFKIRVVTNAPSIVRCGGNSSHRIFIRVRPTELHRHFLEEGQPQDRDDSQQRQADNRSHPTRETEITSIVESGKNLEEIGAEGGTRTHGADNRYNGFRVLRFVCWRVPPWS